MIKADRGEEAQRRQSPDKQLPMMSYHHIKLVAIVSPRSNGDICFPDSAQASGINSIHFIRIQFRSNSGYCCLQVICQRFSILV